MVREKPRERERRGGKGKGGEWRGGKVRSI